MNPIFLPHLCSIYKNTIVTRDLQQISEMKCIGSNIKCKVVEEKGKWINGEYVLQIREDTSIIFDSCAIIEKGFEIHVGDKKYRVSDVQERKFASGYNAGIRATCNSI